MANLNLSEFGEKLFVADADHTFIWDTVGAISKRVSRNSWLNSGTLTSDAPVTISQTWNGTGSTIFQALVVNATTPGTTSSSSSLLLNLQVGGVSKFYVNKGGDVVAGNSFTAPYFATANHFSGPIFRAGAAVVLASGATVGWSASNEFATPDTILLRDGAPNTLALRNGANAQTFNVYGTYTSGTVYERLTLSAPSAANAIIGTNKGSGGGTARGLDLHTDGAARMTITTAGNVGIGTTTPGSTLTVAGTLHFGSNNGALPGGTSYGGHIGSTQDFAIRGTSTVSTNYYLQNGSSGNKNAAIRLLGSGSADHGGLDINTFESSPIIFSTNLTEKARFSATGNLGIGTTSPSSKLQVTGGDVEIETVTSGIIMKAAGTSTRYRITLNAVGTALVFTAI